MPTNLALGYLERILCARRDRPAARKAKAAKRPPTRLLKKRGCGPRRMTTTNCGRGKDPDAASRASLAQGADDRVEHSHVPLRKRERIVQGFRTTGLQRFVSHFPASRIEAYRGHRHCAQAERAGAAYTAATSPWRTRPGKTKVVEKAAF